jgi:molybdenum cofactor cytidylyltransferase
MRGITGILLAAGRSRRFGANKLLASLPDGSPLILASARRLRSALDTVIVVVHPQDHVIPALLAAEPVQLVVSHNADSGMGASLAAAVAASGDAHGWLIALADMPRIQVSTLRRVAQVLYDGASLVAPFHAGRRGHPVGVHARFREELLVLAGDRGARDLLARHAETLTHLNVNDPGILFDVDTPADLVRDTALSHEYPASE